MRDHAVVKGLQRAGLAQLTGCNLETVRYYEKVGLLPEPPHTSGAFASFCGRANSASPWMKSVSCCVSSTSETSRAPRRAPSPPHTSTTCGRRSPI
jgi:MerR family regulatory protein